MNCRPCCVRNLILAHLGVVAWFAIVTPARVEAQSKRTPARVWIAGGLGTGGSTDESASDGIAASLAFAFQNAPHQFTLRYIGIIDPYDESGSALGELSALYWRANAGRLGHAAIGSGFALAIRNDCNTVCASHMKPALPISADLTLRVLPVAALGLQLFVNINGDGVMGGYLATLQIGWLPR